jgi:hypothetical protein
MNFWGNSNYIKNLKVRILDEIFKRKVPLCFDARVKKFTRLLTVKSIYAIMFTDP